MKKIKGGFRVGSPHQAVPNDPELNVIFQKGALKELQRDKVYCINPYFLTV